MRELETTIHSDPSYPRISTFDDDAPPALREGLPNTYRSRHEPHYVDQLSAAAGTQPVRMLALTRIEAAELPAEHTLGDLAKSIADVGILQPLLVRPHDGRFRLIAGRRRLAAARRAGLTEVPCLVHSVSEARALELSQADNLRLDEYQAPAGPVSEPELDEPTAAMMAEVRDAVASVQSCLQLFSGASVGMRQRVALKIIAAEAERAAWALQAREYLASTSPLAHVPVSGAALLEDVERGAGATASLRDGTLQMEPVQGSIVIDGDPALLATTVTGLASALFALGEVVQDPRVQVRLATSGDARVLSVTQPSAVLGRSALSRFLDAGWAERPGGLAAELAIRLARHAAALLGASLSVSSTAGAGTSVTMTFGG